MNRTKSSHTGRKLLAVATAGLAALGICGTIVYNRLTTSESATRSAFAAIESELHQRSAILPTLVTALQGCTAVQELTGQLASANNRLLAATRVEEIIRADSELTGTIGALLDRLQQGIPEGCDIAALQTLYKQLSDRELAIATARKHYNETAIAYNRLLRRFPSKLVAQLGSFEHYSVFVAMPQP